MWHQEKKGAKSNRLIFHVCKSELVRTVNLLQITAYQYWPHWVYQHWSFELLPFKKQNNKNFQLIYLNNRKSVRAPVDVHHPSLTWLAVRASRVCSLSRTLCMSSCSLASATTICSFRLPPGAADTPRLLPSPSPALCMGAWNPALRAGDLEPAGRKKINEQGTTSQLGRVPGAHIAGCACGCLNNETTTANYFMQTWEMREVFRASNCSRVRHLPLPLLANELSRMSPCDLCLWDIGLPLSPSSPPHRTTCGGS